MASKSKLKKLQSAKRKKEHDQARIEKERNKELKRQGIHPDQIQARRRNREYEARSRRKKDTKLEPVVRSGVYYRETPNYPSYERSSGAYVAERLEKAVYTGDKLLGISAMHKSNLVPIFSEDHAKDVSSMRRN